jgi:hypothetical protein
MPFWGTFGNTFEFLEPGGPDHLLPGRPLEQSVRIVPPTGTPAGAGFFVVLRGFEGAFVSPDGRFLRERPFGQFRVRVGVISGALVCRVRLTDINMDDAVFIRVHAFAAFIT